MSVNARSALEQRPSRPIHVLLPTSSFPRYEGDFSGPWILEYCRELVRQGHRVTVVAPGTLGVPSDALSSPGLEVLRFRYAPAERWHTLTQPPGLIPNLKSQPWQGVNLPGFLLCFERAIARRLAVGDVDIVHSQWAIPAGWLAGRAARRAGLPHVITSQGAEFFLPERHPFSHFTRSAVRTADRLLPVSEQMAVRARCYGAIPARTEVVPNTVNTEVFRRDVASDFRQRHDIAADRPVVLTVRRLVHEKRVEDLLDAFAALPGRGEAVLVIGGDGPERAALEQRCRTLGIERDVRFIGFVDNIDLPPIYAAADVYVLSSQQEGLSLSLLEAMASGPAVITTASTGGDELVEHGTNGFLYAVGDVSALTSALRECLALSAESRRTLRDAARRTIVEGYSVVCMVRRWVEIYRELLGVDRG